MSVPDLMCLVDVRRCLVRLDVSVICRINRGVSRVVRIMNLIVGSFALSMSLRL